MSTWLNPTPLPLWAGVGVGLFFLVSGFVIPFSFERYDRLGFLVARFFRLWPTYAIGVRLTAAAIWVGNSLAGQVFPYSGGEVLINSILGLREALLARNFDGIVWTLEIEIKFYVRGGAYRALAPSRIDADFHRSRGAVRDCGACRAFSTLRWIYGALGRCCSVRSS